MTAASDRSAYLAEVRGLLWPAPDVSAEQPAARLRPGPGGASRTTELVVVPSLRDPRLLIPAGRRAGAAAVRRYGQPSSRRARLAARALSLAVAGGAGRVLLRDRLEIAVPPGAPAIETHLAGLLGTDVRLSMHIGAARANRKPVLQVLTPAGTTVAYAKIGHTPLTRRLVRDELAALRDLAAARPVTLTAPAPLGLSRWAGLDVLLLSPLPVGEGRRAPDPVRLAAAVSEITGLGGRSRGGLTASRYWTALAGRLGAAPPGPDADTLRGLLDKLAARHGQAELEFGAWHGDWTPWNLAVTRDGLLVWDWERFAAGVPVGFDSLHYWLQTAVVTRRQDPAAAAVQCAGQAPGLLAPLGVDPAAARVTAWLYLSELSARYLADRQAEAGARLGAPGRWLIPALAAALTGTENT